MDQSPYESPMEGRPKPDKPRLPRAAFIAAVVIGFMLAVALCDWLIFKLIEFRTLSNHSR